MKTYLSIILAATLSSVAYAGDNADKPFIEIKKEGEIRAMGDNCGRQKSGLNRRFDECKFGACAHPSGATADAEAIGLTAQLIDAGYTRGLTAGHKTVKNWIDTDWGDIDLPNTYLAYACANK